jgi:2-methylisocitrate lyase-like PEP mutase family enzyme
VTPETQGMSSTQRIGPVRREGVDVVDGERRVPSGLGGRHFTDQPSRLSELLRGSKAIVVPGVVDALSARLVEQAGFQACFATGAGVSNSQLGLPDIGLLAQTEMVEQVARIVDATDLPVIADADTGHCGPIAVMRTVHLFELTGAAGITIEDQAMPKRCGHFSGTRLIPTNEMLAKIDAACLARKDPRFVVIARTDARSVLGLDEAVARARAYSDAGADAIFLEAPQSVDELELIPKELPGIPLVVNIVEGGKTPLLPLDELERLGYRVVLYANFLLRAMLKAGQEALEHLQSHGDTAGFAHRILDWDERQALVNLPDVEALEDDIHTRWSS